MGNFTVENGIAIQAEHLAQWKKALKPELYAQLEKWATSFNSRARDGYDVVRGDQLTQYVICVFCNNIPEVDMTSDVSAWLE